MIRLAHRLPLVACLLLLAAAPALAVVNTTGDVKPIAPPNPFGLPFGVPAADEDLDGIPDYIDADGNNLLLPPNPNDPATWLNASVWIDYDSTQNILVGESAYGLLEINGRTKLRYQHVVLGGVSEDTPGVPSTYSLSTLDDDASDFNYVVDLSAPLVGGSGFGDMLVSGTDTVFNNDPNIIGAGEQAAINFASGNPASETVVNLEDDVTFINPINGTNGITTRRSGRGDGFDMYVGFLNSGRLTVNTGGRVEIQDALMAGIAEGVTGDVFVDGVGSYLGAYGREELDRNLQSTSSTGVLATTSFIGGSGRGTLEVTNGARADFFSGLSIGAETGGMIAPLLGDGPGRGEVTVGGDTSIATVTAYSAPNTLPTAFDFGGQGLALAVGETRVAANIFDAPTVPDESLGRGELEIQEGGRVVTAFAATYINTVAGDANAYVGRNGVVRMRGGDLDVAESLINDGEINGYGHVRAETIDTSDNSVITGGDPNANIASLVAEELRIELTGDAGAPTTFTNRGLVNGLVDLDVAGVIANGTRDGGADEFEGIIEVAGTVRGTALVNELGSRLVGLSDANGPLRLRLSDTTLSGDARAGQDFGALQNRGEISGEVDFILQGGLANGDNLLPRSSPPGGSAQSNGGVITASGEIRAATFINHVDAEVRVGPGRTLKVFATADAPTQLTDADTGIPISGGGTDAIYRQMNLGSISVDGGTLEVGYQTDAPLMPVISGTGTFDTSEAFYNARYLVFDDTTSTVEETSVGTITANDSTLSFQSGLVNTGVLAFTGGTNTVTGDVFNFTIDYSGSADPAGLFPGAIVVSGDGTSVTFEDDVVNTGVISIGPTDNVVNFLGDLDNTGGTIQVAVDILTTVSAYITVAGDVSINGGSLGLGGGAGPIDPSIVTATAPGGLALATADDVGFNQVILQATGDLSEDSLFTELLLPETVDGVYWDIIYDLVADEVRLELIASDAFGADFTGDGIVNTDDVDVWIRNAGIVSGASVIQGDADLDGDVDLADYDLLMDQLLTGVPVGGVALAMAVPEPAAAGLMLLAVMTGWAGRRR